MRRDAVWTAEPGDERSICPKWRTADGSSCCPVTSGDLARLEPLDGDCAGDSVSRGNRSAF